MKSALSVYLILLLFLPDYPVFAQNGDGDSAGTSEEATQTTPSGQTADPNNPPVDIRQQPYEYYYWPEENLDNFGLSTLGSGEGGSTLGRTLKRKSNIEVNSPKEPEKDAQGTDGGPEGGDNGTALFPPEEGDIDSGTVVEEEAPQSSPSESPIYEWVDDKGNIHITNNIGDVPLKYQQEIYKQKNTGE